ncbi:MAG: YceD family protein, partial [Acidimicrobiia bacterium]
MHFETDATELGGIGGARLDDQPLFVDAVLERVPDGVVVQGTVRGFYAAQCSRCLRPVHREIVTAVRELFEAVPIEGETYPLVGDEIDLELPVRDALLLELPAAPLCRDDCAGLCSLCGVDRNQSSCDCDMTI